MGFDVSHGAFHGAYTSFNRFRVAICDAIGGKWPHFADTDQTWYWGDGYSHETHPGLGVLLNHSDCDGEIDPMTCKNLADELEALVPALDGLGIGSGHIARNGGYGDTARRFIAGCRRAFDANEPLEFY